jgi:hypothetical protein
LCLLARVLGTCPFLALPLLPASQELIRSPPHGVRQSAYRVRDPAYRSRRGRENLLILFQRLARLEVVDLPTPLLEPLVERIVGTRVNRGDYPSSGGTIVKLYFAAAERRLATSS